ncbi:hypothetical protein, partial [Streptomyces sp. NPDC056650]|uniref:hypothetical protein n=1 Tax=Streptomyces sp. NPDC056650 TaxID=3154856 RepID=UPI003449ED88
NAGVRELGHVRRSRGVDDGGVLRHTPPPFPSRVSSPESRGDSSTFDGLIPQLPRSQKAD